MGTSGSSLKASMGISSQWATGQRAEERNWLYKRFMLLFVSSSQIDCTRTAIVGMVFWFPPNHWNAKLQSFSRILTPLPQMFNTSFTDYMSSPWFVLITKLYTKIAMISFLNKLCYTISFIGYFELAISITNLIRIIFTRSRSWNNFLYVFI